ncbi:putative reverse transcriptase domain, ribonuclease H-like domain, aspartic peptidase domain protein [Tanacetum coccineum]
MAIPPPPPVTQPQNVANTVNDPLYIASSDHPGMVLTNTPFNGTSFHGWSRNVKMALGAKLKLGFIDGSCNRPSVDNVDEQRWIRCDYMVTCWILNSMVAELSDAFLYAQSAFELWKEITERCWDELQNLSGLPTCNCGKLRECTCSVNEKFVERDSNSKLIQFLMKLSDGYESVISQILAMDPFPRGNSSKKDGKNVRNEFKNDGKRVLFMEYLVNISKRRAFWSLNEAILKITILTTNTPYPSRKIRRIRACTHQRPQRKQAQYACMTMSSTSKLFTPYKEPEREFRSSRRHFKTPSLDELRSPDFNLFSDQEYSKEEVAETMAETMEQYMSKT